MDEILEEQPDPNLLNPYNTSIAMDCSRDPPYNTIIAMVFLEILANKRKLYGPFIGFNCPKVTVPLQGDNLLFTTKSPGVLGTHLIDLGRIKG